jgi:hypothetical protein
MSSLHPTLRLQKIYHSVENRQVQMFHCCMLKMSMTKETHPRICKSKLRTVTKPSNFTTVVKIWLAFWEHSRKIFIFKAVSMSKRNRMFPNFLCYWHLCSVSVWRHLFLLSLPYTQRITGGTYIYIYISGVTAVVYLAFYHHVLLLHEFTTYSHHAQI